LNSHLIALCPKYWRQKYWHQKLLKSDNTFLKLLKMSRMFFPDTVHIQMCLELRLDVQYQWSVMN